MKGWKTILFNSIAAIAGVFAENADVIASPDNTGYVITAVAVVNMILRGITDTPVFRAEK